MFNDFATWPCKRCAFMVGMKEEKKNKISSLKCYSMSWKAVRNLPNVHTDLFSNLSLWCDPFPCFILRYSFSLHTPTWVPSIYSFKQLFYKAMLEWVISWCIWWAGQQYRTMCLKFANTKLCFGPVTMLFHWIREKEKKTHPERDTCIFCKVEKSIPIIKSRVKRSNALLSGLCRMWNSLSFVYLWY